MKETNQRQKERSDAAAKGSAAARERIGDRSNEKRGRYGDNGEDRTAEQGTRNGNEMPLWYGMVYTNGYTGSTPVTPCSLPLP